MFKNFEVYQAILAGKRVQKVGTWPTYSGQEAITMVCDSKNYDSFNVLPPLQENFIVLGQFSLDGRVEVFMPEDGEAVQDLAENYPTHKVYRLKIDPRTLELSVEELAEPLKENAK